MSAEVDASCTDRYGQCVAREEPAAGGTDDPAESPRKTELLHDVVRYLEARGIADLSLSPLARELGTSKRMLIYYFDSRDNLIREALAASRPDVASMFSDVDDAESLRAAALRLWRAITTGEQHRPIRILFQVLSLASTQPERYHDFAVDSINVMLEPIAGVYQRLGIGAKEARARSSLLVSGLRGLCQDRILTGEAKRTDTAARELIETATALPDPPTPSA